MPNARVLVKDHYAHFCHVRQADDLARHLEQLLLDVTVRAGSADRQGSEH
jgi:hypothetical protein